MNIETKDAVEGALAALGSKVTYGAGQEPLSPAGCCPPNSPCYRAVVPALAVLVMGYGAWATHQQSIGEARK